MVTSFSLCVHNVLAGDTIWVAVWSVLPHVVSYYARVIRPVYIGCICMWGAYYASFTYTCIPANVGLAFHYEELQLHLACICVLLYELSGLFVSLCTWSKPSYRTTWSFYVHTCIISNFDIGYIPLKS